MQASRQQIKDLGRLKKRSDFLRVQRQGRKWVSRGLILQVKDNSDQERNVGITVTRKVSVSAVVRNRIKRRLRAVAADVLPEYAVKGYDYILVGRIETERRLYSDLKNDLKWCLKKLNLKNKANEDSVES